MGKGLSVDFGAINEQNVAQVCLFVCLFVCLPKLYIYIYISFYFCCMNVCFITDLMFYFIWMEC